MNTVSRTGNRNRHLPAFLLLLLRAGPAHGAALKARLDDMLPRLAIEAGAIYRALRELEARGALVSNWDRVESGQARRIYTITDIGQEELACWHRDICQRRQALQIFLDLYEQGADHDAAAG